MRVLLVAEEANPEWTSVPLVGWSHSRALARIADVHLVTQVRNRDALLRAGLRQGADFTEIDSERIARPIYHLAKGLRGGEGASWTTNTALTALSYYYFEALVWRTFRDQLAQGEFDLVHRLTPLSPAIPSLLAGKCARFGVPFVIGPLNGGVPWPRGFGEVRRAEREWLSYVRHAHKLLPGYRATRRHADAILVGSIDTWRQIPDAYRDRCVYIPENAVDPSRFPSVRSHRASLPLRAIFVGRLVPYKGADMLLEAALPLLRSGVLRIEILGDGPQQAHLSSFVEREKLEETVELAGWVEHQRLHERMSSADLLVFPSIREFGGGVVLEAMALGVVPMVVRYGGPGELVTPETGFLIEIGSRDRIVRDLRNAIEGLTRDPEEIDRRSGPARDRVQRNYTWSAKAQQVAQVYEWVVGRRVSKPDFGMPFP
jgi:glycosyltransferase involved in cell wall biosynthesis